VPRADTGAHFSKEMNPKRTRDNFGVQAAGAWARLVDQAKCNSLRLVELVYGLAHKIDLAGV
jgi:hypothetical protein